MCNKEKFWQSLCNCLNAEELLEDSRFKDFSARLVHRSIDLHIFL